jgi:hypothetical protein
LPRIAAEHVEAERIRQRLVAPPQLSLAPPSPVPSSWVETAEEVTIVPDVVADDCDAEHGGLEHGGLEHDWSDPQIVKSADVAGLIPLLVAVSVYPMPDWLIGRSENEATPPLVSTVVIPTASRDRDSPWA